MLRYFANGRVHWKGRMRCNTRTNWEFYAVTEGRCAVTFRDNDRVELQERTFWLFAPECPHAWHDDTRRSYRRLVLHFSSVPHPLDEIVRARGGWISRPLSNGDVHRLEAIARELEPHFCHPVVASPLHYQRHLMDLALLLLDGDKQAAEPLTLTDVASFRVERALSWYADHLQRHPTVKEVADAIHVSPSHLRRLFAEVRRASPKDLFRRVRLEKAQDLLGRTSLTLDEIARTCGYTNASHFCREYKTAHHFTPSTWRRRLIDRFVRPLPPGIVPVREFSARPGERRLRA